MFQSVFFTVPWVEDCPEPSLWMLYFCGIQEYKPPQPPEPGGQGVSPGWQCKNRAPDIKTRVSDTCTCSPPGNSGALGHGRGKAQRYCPFSEVYGKGCSQLSNLCLIRSLLLRLDLWWLANRPLSWRDWVHWSVDSCCALRLVAV